MRWPAGSCPNRPRTPRCCPAPTRSAYVDIDDTIRRTYGYAKQGAGYGYSKVKGLNELIGIVSTPLAAPVIAATRLRKGPSNSARGAAAFVAESIRTARACGASGLLAVRADSAFYGADVVNTCRAVGVRFSVTVRMNVSVKAAIAGIGEAVWKAIKYPKAVWDEEGQCWVSGAETAETTYTTYTTFTSKPKRQQVTARLIVRRVKRLNPAAVPEEQGTLFDTWRCHAAFTDSPLSLFDAEREHRRHAVVEQVIADLTNGPFAHAPSGRFQANSAWLALAALAYDLTRAAGALASAFHARATTATIRGHLINALARPARSARRLTLHLPERWLWADDFTQLFDLVHAPPPTAGEALPSRPTCRASWRNSACATASRPSSLPTGSDWCPARREPARPRAPSCSRQDGTPKDGRAGMDSLGAHTDSTPT